MSEDQKLAWAVHRFLQGDDEMLGVILRKLDIHPTAEENSIEAKYIQPDTLS